MGSYRSSNVQQTGKKGSDASNVAVGKRTLAEPRWQRDRQGGPRRAEGCIDKGRDRLAVGALLKLHFFFLVTFKLQRYTVLFYISDSDCSKWGSVPLLCFPKTTFFFFLVTFKLRRYTVLFYIRLCSDSDCSKWGSVPLLCFPVFS